MKKTAYLLMISFIVVTLSSCLVTHPTTAPPPLKKEIRPAKPGPLYVWVDGYWKWTGSGYSWIKGHWSKAPQGKMWVQGRWEKRGSHWVWVGGRWRRR
jgi:hypothetical protein